MTSNSRSREKPSKQSSYSLITSKSVKLSSTLEDLGTHGKSDSPTSNRRHYSLPTLRWESRTDLQGYSLCGLKHDILYKSQEAHDQTDAGTDALQLPPLLHDWSSRGSEVLRQPPFRKTSHLIPTHALEGPLENDVVVDVLLARHRKSRVILQLARQADALHHRDATGGFTALCKSCRRCSEQGAAAT